MALKDFLHDIPKIKISEETERQFQEAVKDKGVNYVATRENHPKVMKEFFAAFIKKMDESVKE